MEGELLVAAQTLAFGLVVIARMQMTSHLARKRMWGFGFSICAAIVFMTIMVTQGLYILAAMDLTILCLDTRGVLNNYREVKNDDSQGFVRHVDSGPEGL